MICSYKLPIESEDYHRKALIDESEKEIDVDDAICICENDVEAQSIASFEDNTSPFDFLLTKYGQKSPVFSIHFLESFLQYFVNSEMNDTELLFYIIDGPVENSTRLLKLQILDLLYVDPSSTLPIIHHIISKTTDCGKEIFIQSGGLYVLFYFIRNPDYCQLIVEIFDMISNVEMNLCDDILPPNAFSSIQCNIDTTQILEFDSFLKILISFEDLQILPFVVTSLLNVFRRSEKVVEKFGMIIFDSSFIFNMLNIFNDNYIAIHNLIELFNILCDHFDMDEFRVDLVHFFYELFMTCEYNLKIEIIPSFLNTIESANASICLPLLSSETIEILDECVHLETKKFIPDIIDIVTDFASKIVMLSDDETENEGEDYLCQLRGILDFLADDEDSSISTKAKAGIKMIGNLF